MIEKLSFQGIVLSIQPRIRLDRSFNEFSHSYLGYILKIKGEISQENLIFTVGIGKSAQEKNMFCKHDVASGLCLPAQNPKLESAQFYKVSKLQNKKNKKNEDLNLQTPPWNGIPPTLEIYRARGKRRLSKQSYNTKCSSCIWACFMPTVLTIDHWNPEEKKYRKETFCYGPKSCQFYKPGPQRMLYGRKGLSMLEEDWVDEEAVSHRSLDE